MGITISTVRRVEFASRAALESDAVMAVGARRAAARTTGRLRVAGLFAGIGGLELGMASTGHRTVLLCENDVAAAAVLRHRFPECELRSDVRALRPRDLPEDVDVLTAGFPCQNLSQVGDTAGIAGPKSGLVDEVFRLLERRRVPWVVLENVPFMLHLDRGTAMRRITDELHRLGYRWAYRVVDSRAFGLPQRRRRVFVVAAQGDRNPTGVLFADDVVGPAEPPWRHGTPVGFYWTEGNRGVGWAVDAIPTLKGGSSWGIASAPAVLCANGRVVMPGIEDAEALQGFDRGWTQLATDCGHGRFRWRMVGNAVNVRAAAWLGERLRCPGAFDRSRLAAPIEGGRWPNAACDLGDGARGVDVGEWPRSAERVGIETFLQAPRLLSERATTGFVERAARAELARKLSFARGFLDALRRHAQGQKAVAGRPLDVAATR